MLPTLCRISTRFPSALAPGAGKPRPRPAPLHQRLRRNVRSRRRCLRRRLLCRRNLGRYLDRRLRGSAFGRSPLRRVSMSTVRCFILCSSAEKHTHPSSLTEEPPTNHARAIVRNYVTAPARRILQPTRLPATRLQRFQQTLLEALPSRRLPARRPLDRRQLHFAKTSMRSDKVPLCAPTCE